MHVQVYDFMILLTFSLDMILYSSFADILNIKIIFL